MPDKITQGIEKRAFIIGAAAAAAAVIFRQGGLGMGIALGMLISLLNFKLLVRKVELSAVRQGHNPAAFFAGCIFRYIFMGAALWICISRGLSYFIGAASGLFAVRIAIYSYSFIGEKKETARG